ncbi:DsbA family oxidoreductase [Actinoplanes aureus]|jgi:predicted DsbA family dithiol-disulfide isomerase|uniref:DsbA family protein n=1 Tax=Actinoplanes aureus TaxID=2792083 RepID=A0A931FXL9_9ACTN|nr:DsbA family protein [Actinoplanes aureus]MBG0563698.1 DsbA family protein [Actinoplanes aureus]
MEVTYYFDPACPFTWRTSRWLLSVAPERGLTVRWSPFSLAILNGDDVPEQYRAMSDASSRALRLVAALRADGRQDEIAAFYTELGNRTHEAGAWISDEIVSAAAEAAGTERAATILDDPAWDEAVRESHETAMALAGPGIGSPVLQVAGATRGLHGPIISEVPPLAESLRIWDATATLISIDSFFEVKRGRD